jgi:hypothetical protein
MAAKVLDNCLGCLWTSAKSTAGYKDVRSEVDETDDNGDGEGLNFT